MDLTLERDGEGYRLTRDDGKSWRCAIGRGGVVLDKREGDGGTPVGVWPIRRLVYRPDRGDAPETGIPATAMSESDGWCDDPADAAYNRPVTLPYPASHERMWRDDHLYDIVIILGHNDDPPQPGKGSAIFWHVAREGYAPTEGCLALNKGDLREALRGLDGNTRIIVPNGLAKD